MKKTGLVISCAIIAYFQLVAPAQAEILTAEDGYNFQVTEYCSDYAKKSVTGYMAERGNMDARDQYTLLGQYFSDCLNREGVHMKKDVSFLEGRYYNDR